jgi:predicted xylose isomerase-like sugar epimerase
VQQYSNLYSFDPYVKFYKTIEEKEAMVKEKLENLNNIVDINNSI